VTRRLCLTVCAIHLGVFFGIFGLFPLSKAAGISSDFLQSIFVFWGVLVILLFPFGFGSLVMTGAYYLMRRHMGYSQDYFERWSLNWTLLGFLIWRELRSQLAKKGGKGEHG
jgi:hypothetical protein